MHELRDYQLTDCLDIETSTAKRVLYTLPTGGGKTTVAVQVIADAVDAGEHVLFLAHRKELIDQAVKRLKEAGMPEEWIGVIRADEPTNPKAPVQVASVQTVIRRKRPKADLVVVDEAHHSEAETYKTITGWYPRARVLGLTATPFLANGDGLDERFDEIVQGPAHSELFAEGWLTKPQMWTAPADFLPDTKGLKKVAGDFHQGELAKVANRPAIVGRIVEHWKKHALNLATVLYAVDIAHAKACRDAFEAAGIVAEHIDGTTPEGEREDILARLRLGKTKVVTNCGVFTEGWDFPGLQCVILARPTRSLGLYLQMCGRVMRKDGRKRKVILDHAGIARWADVPWVDRQYTLEGIGRSGEGRGLVLKHCPGCDAAVPTITRTCPECEHEFWTLESGPPEEVAAQLVKVEPRQSVCFGPSEDGSEACPKKRTPGAKAFRPSVICRREGGPWRCAQCSHLTPKRRAKIAKANRELAKDPEWRKNNSERLRRLFQDPEWSAKRAEANRKRAEDPEWRARNAEGSRKRAEDPVWRKKHAEAMRALASSPEWRAKMGEKNRKQAQDPEWRAKNDENLKKARAAKNKQPEDSANGEQQ